MAGEQKVSRRGVLGVLGLVAAGAAGIGATLRGRHGPRPVLAEGTTRTVDEHGEWWAPPGTGRRPTVVLVHGGYWRSGYDRSLEDAVAADLAGRGYLCWNIDYRSSASPWPATLDDAAAAYDRLAVGALAGRVDHDRVAVVGHSAGGHLALWLASRERLPAGAPGAGPTGPRPALVVAQAPVAALASASRQGLGGGAVDALLGGSPKQVPQRYRQADPVALLPTGVPAVLVHGSGDTTVPLSQSREYVAAAGAAAELVTVPGGHFEHLDPASEACARMRDALARLSGP